MSSPVDDDVAAAIHKLSVNQRVSAELAPSMYAQESLDDELFESTEERTALLRRQHRSDSMMTDMTMIESRTRKGNVLTSVYNLVATMVGGGTLSIPYAFRRAGVIPAVVLFVILGSMSAFGLLLLVACKKYGEDERRKRRKERYGEAYTPRFSGAGYFVAGAESTRSSGDGTHIPDPELPEHEIIDSVAGLAQLAWGIWAERFVCLILFFLIILAQIAYWVLLGDNLPSLIHHFKPGAHGPFASREFTTGIAVAILMPPCSVKSLTALRFVSFLCLVAIGYLAFAVSYRSLEFNIPKHFNPPQMGKMEMVGSFNGILIAIVLESLSFLCHFNVLAVKEELGKPTRRKVKQIVFLTTALPFVLYCIIGFFGYAQFRELTQQDILRNYPPGDTLTFIGTCGLVLAIMLSVPLLVHPARRLAMLLCVPGYKETTLTRTLLTMFIMLSTYAASTQITNVVVVWGFTGATVGISCMYILPPVFFLRFRQLRNEWTGYAWLYHDGMNIAASMLCVVGAMLVVICTYVTVVDLKELS